MTQIILDANAANRLNETTVPVELCDPTGRVLGHFVPRVDMSNWDPVSPDVSEEELSRRASSTGKRYRTAEVLAHLESL